MGTIKGVSFSVKFLMYLRIPLLVRERYSKIAMSDIQKKYSHFVFWWGNGCFLKHVSFTVLLCLLSFTKRYDCCLSFLLQRQRNRATEGHLGSPVAGRWLEVRLVLQLGFCLGS